MTTPCLICNSSAVLSQEAAKALTLMVCTLNGFLSVAQRAHMPDQVELGETQSPIERAMTLLVEGVASATSDWTENQALLLDVQRYQFMGFDCVCLRCGAKFDAATEP